MREQGYEIVFKDPSADATQAVQRVLWERWTAEEVGENEFTGQLFDEHGRIYHGCTAFDAGPDRSPFVVEFEVGVAEVAPGEPPAAVLERASKDVGSRA